MGPSPRRPGGLLERSGVTDRESEVLAAIAERLRNREIAQRLHVSVRTVESHVAALLRKLAVPDRAGLIELGRQVGGSPPADPPQLAPLPAPLTSLVGRERAASRLTVLLGRHRLVTLTGPAGVGKTRLALHTAAALTDQVADGARLADLAPVSPPRVGDTLARALGLVPRPDRPLGDLLRAVGDDLRCLLLVDNCEHVVAETAQLVAELLAAGGELRVLATSREPLGVPGEVCFPVPPLPVPVGDAAQRAATAGGYDAVRLFVDRAAAASPGFTLSDANAPAVATLCRRLDGLPLAIELAAARVRTFPPAELVGHLDERFALLSGGARTAPPRHRTLRAAIDWSYQLLDGDERALLDRLGVFPADFDYQAVPAVCDLDRGAVLTLLPRLVEKSLVSTARGRYRLLETIRAYAADRLAATGAGAVARARHASYYLDLAERTGEDLRGSDQRACLDRLSAELPNLRAAMDHSGDGDAATAWRWVVALWRFWVATGQRREGYERSQRALAMGDPPATPVAVAGLVAASDLLQPLDSGASFAMAQRATRLATGLDDFSRGEAARVLGNAAGWVEPELAEPALHEALARFGDEHSWERAAAMLALVCAAGEPADALRWGRESVALFRRVGDRMYAANTLFIMAQRAMSAGLAGDEVHAWITESRALAEAAGSEDDQAHATVAMAQLAWLRGEHDHAAEQMEACLPTLRRLGDERCTGRALFVLGERARQLGQLARAEELLRGCLEAITRAGQPTVLAAALEALAAVRYARQVEAIT